MDQKKLLMTESLMKQMLTRLLFKQTKMQSKRLKKIKLKPSNKMKLENKKEEKQEKRELRMKNWKDSETP